VLPTVLCQQRCGSSHVGADLDSTVQLDMIRIQILTTMAKFTCLLFILRYVIGVGAGVTFA
jgi:hypothetical protein